MDLHRSGPLSVAACPTLQASSCSGACARPPGSSGLRSPWPARSFVEGALPPSSVLGIARSSRSIVLSLSMLVVQNATGQYSPRLPRLPALPAMGF